MIKCPTMMCLAIGEKKRKKVGRRPMLRVPNASFVSWLQLHQWSFLHLSLYRPPPYLQSHILASATNLQVQRCETQAVMIKNKKIKKSEINKVLNSSPGRDLSRSWSSTWLADSGKLRTPVLIDRSMASLQQERKFIFCPKELVTSFLARRDEISCWREEIK